MIDTDTLDSLKGQRIRYVLHDGESSAGLLQGVTNETIFLAGEATGVARAKIARIEPASLYCDSCESAAFRLFDGICASCYRVEAKRLPAHRETCSRCGERPGVRNPRSGGAGEFLCVQCHAISGEGLTVHPAHADVIAECATEDVSSSKHEWQRVRGARFRCVRCRSAEKYDTELLARTLKRV